MMNQTKKHTTGKKLLALLLALIMTVSLLPMSVFAAEPGAEETPVVEGQTQPAAETGEDDAEQAQEPDADEANEDEAPVDEGEDTALPGDAEGDADDADAADDGIAAFAATDATMQYRILHLDCGREYFSKDWIIALVNEMSAAGYNQLQLAFGNGGFRFVLNDMAVGDYGSDEVKTAIKAGNEYYNTYGDAEDGLNSSSEWLTYDPKVNALTESEMTEIISYASSKGIEIVPMFNTPGHMHALLAAMEKLGIGGTLSVKAGCMNLENTAAVAFTKALIEKYAAYFSGKGCKFFNLAMDEYNSFDSTFYTYAKDAIGIVTKYKMTPRVFNDGARTQKGSVSTGTQVCFWYGSNLNQIADSYSVINTNHDYYYVSTNESWNLNIEGYTFVGDYNESIWVRKAEQFSNTVFYGRVTLDNPVGSMFCVWCNTPGKNDETEIAHQIRMILRVMAARMDNKTTYSSSDVIVTGGFNADGTINGSSGGTEPETPVIKQDDTTVSGSKVQVAMGATTTLTLSGNKTATWSSSDEKILKLEAVSSKTRAAVAGTNAVQVVPVATGTATVTAKLDDGAELSTEVTVTAAPEPTTVNVELKVGDTSQVYEGAAGATITTAGNGKVATANLVPFKQDGNTKRTLGTKISAGEGVIYDGNGYYIKIVDGTSIKSTESIDEATVFTVTYSLKYLSDGTPITYYNIQVKGGTSTQFLNAHKANDYGYYTLELGESYDWTYDRSYGYCSRNNRYIACFNGSWYMTSSRTGENYGWLYEINEDPVPEKNVTNITFTGVKAGTTTYVIDDVTYVVTVKAKEVPVTLEVDDSVTFDVGTDKISTADPINEAIATAKVSNDGILTLTGMSEGETSCTVGDTQYKITVVKKSTVAGSDLYVDLWVTNHGVLPNNTTGLTVTEGKRDSNNACRVTITYQAEAFNSVDGQLLSKYLPQKGKDVSEKNTATAVYWKTRYLPASVRQTIDGWTNKSGFGTDVLSGEAGGKDIERIRYYAGTWSYLPVDSSEWVAFTTASTDTTNKAAVTSDETGAQIAVFYLLETEVTNEVITFVTDWPDSQSLALYGVALDYCVKYQGEKTRNPSSYGMGKTTQWFQTEGNTADAAYTNGYMYTAANTPDDWKGNANTKYYRVINNIEATNSSDYEVYMITVTPSAAFNDSDNTIDCPDTIDYSGYIDTKAEKVIWAESLETAESSDMTLHSELQIGGEPRVNRVLIQRGTGMLITYYVRAREKQDNLHVYYIDRKSNVGIYDYEIIPSTEKTDNVTFEGFTWDKDNIAAGFTNSTNWVWNDQGKKQSVEWDLAKLKDIAAKYKVSYKLVDIQVENGADGKPYKVLKLYYESDNSRTYVVDFGVPAKVERLGKEEFTKVTAGKTDLFADGKTTNAEANATNGKLYVGSDKELYYQLTTMEYTAPDVFNVTYTYADNTSNPYTVTFIPASNVYYEDDDAFITFAGGQGKANAAQWEVELDKGKTAADESKQIAEVLSMAKNVYGRDPTYENSTMFSLGRAHKVTVSADMVNNWNENSDAWPTAEFTFKGTGFDVISLTDNKSGLLICKVVNVATGEIKYNKFVNDYYGYGYVSGKWIKVDNDAANALYQLPVVKVDGLPYSEYTVTLTVGYSALFDNANRRSYSFWLDGVRIYDPAGKTLDETYAKDGEGWPKYIELHDELVKTTDATVKHGLLFIEDHKDAELADYTSYGPNHEVYLLPGQTIAFKLDDVSNVDKVQIGAKAPMGNAMLKVGDNEVAELKTATDMYYDITKYAIDVSGAAQVVTITNGGAEGTILSLTQLKVTHDTDGTKASLAILNETERQQVVQMVRAMYAPVEPEVFTPERFEASWNRSTVKVGQKATLTVKTSTDVDAITVDGVTVTNYRTRTQRTGWGWNATKVTYREFTYTITAAEAGTLDYSVVAVNADGVSSEPISAMLTVQAVQRPQRPSWLDKIFSRWF